MPLGAITMRFTQSALAVALFAPAVLSSPIPPPEKRLDLSFIPLDAVQLGGLVSQVRTTYDSLICKTGPRSDCIGEYFNKYTGFSGILDSTIGYDNVVALDVLADRACIASGNQGSACNEVLAYAYAWYQAQQNGYTYRQVGEMLGPNNMAAINDDLNRLCLEYDYQNESHGFCKLLLGDTDTLANSILGHDTLAEDNNNSNTLDYLGLSAILPKPQPLGV